MLIRLTKKGDTEQQKAQMTTMGSIAEPQI